MLCFLGNEVPVVQQHNGPEAAKFPSYDQQRVYPHQAVNFDKMYPNQKHGYPDNLLQFRNFGQHQQFDQPSISQEYELLNGPELPRYARAMNQPFYERMLLIFFFN